MNLRQEQVSSETDRYRIEGAFTLPSGAHPALEKWNEQRHART